MKSVHVVALALALSIPSAAFVTPIPAEANPKPHSEKPTHPVATFQVRGDILSFTPRMKTERAVLKISGPFDFFQSTTFVDGTQPYFAVRDDSEGVRPDGPYRYEIVVSPNLPPSEPTVGAREDNVSRAGQDRPPLHRAPETRQSGAFVILNSTLIVPGAQGDPSELPPGGPVDDRDPTGQRDQVVTDDFIVLGGLNVGFDAVNGKDFGFDTVILSEHNLRILFEDTSTAASFPSTDWRLTANDSANGGANKFSIDDVTAGTVPFLIEGGAKNHTLYVDSNNNVGINTSAPVVNLHVLDGNTATLRLEQDNSGGFTPQTWDIGSNESNFFVRDVTNASALPFRIKPGSPQNSIFIQSNGVGILTEDPSAALHVSGSAKIDGNLTVSKEGAVLKVEDQSSSASQRILLQLVNKGATAMSYQDTSGSQTWSTGITTSGKFLINEGSQSPIEFELDTSGNLCLAGTVTCTSDRNAKKNIESVDPEKVLAKALAVPVSTWSYKRDEESVRHMGPMAQDFYAAFELGASDRQIAPMDLVAVTLAALQGLHLQLENERLENGRLRSNLDAVSKNFELLADRVNALETAAEQVAAE